MVPWRGRRHLPIRSIVARRKASRKDLLDLGLRNPLLNHRTLRSKGITVVDELSRMVFCILVRGGVGASAYLRRLFENAVTVVTAVTTFGWHPLLFWVAIYMSSLPHVCTITAGGYSPVRVTVVMEVTTETYIGGSLLLLLPAYSVLR